MQLQEAMGVTCISPVLRKYPIYEGAKRPSDRFTRLGSGWFGVCCRKRGSNMYMYMYFAIDCKLDTSPVAAQMHYV